MIKVIIDRLTGRTRDNISPGKLVCAANIVYRDTPTKKKLSALNRAKSIYEPLSYTVWRNHHEN